MTSLGDLLHALRDPTALISAVGTAGITAVIFIETGLLFPFLPGDIAKVCLAAAAVLGVNHARRKDTLRPII